MRKWGQKKYRPGAVWQAKDYDTSPQPVHFQIIAPGEFPNERKCTIIHKYSHHEKHNTEGVYTLRHLKKHFVCIKEGK